MRRSLTFQLAITRDVANPFGYARQYVQTKKLGRKARFFFPHDTRAAPWWQGENARIASLATAARRALPLFTDDSVFSKKLRTYATDQLNWILGLNPFDASMLQGVGHNNPEYLFSAVGNTPSGQAASSTASPRLTTPETTPASTTACVTHRHIPIPRGAGTNNGCRMMRGTCWPWHRATARPFQSHDDHAQSCGVRFTWRAA